MMNSKIKLILFIFYFSQNTLLLSQSVGLDDGIEAAQTHITFPANENGTNRINNYALMANGFELADSTTTVSSASIFSVMGIIDLNGGKLYLERDLRINNTSDLDFGGQIFGDYYSLIFPKVISELTFLSSSPYFDNTHLIFNSDVLFTNASTFNGDCLIDGKGKKLTLVNGATIIVLSDSSLTFKNVRLNGVCDNNISCAANSSSLMFQDSKMTLSSDFKFDIGSITFKGDVIISGTNKFIYTTKLGSTIDSHSTLYLDKSTTFSYAPKIANRDLIYMKDATSGLYLNNCTLQSTTTGLRLTRGRLFLDNQITFSSNATSVSESICFGNNNSQDDLNIFVLPGLSFNVYGYLDYANSS